MGHQIVPYTFIESNKLPLLIAPKDMRRRAPQRRWRRLAFNAGTSNPTTCRSRSHIAAFATPTSIKPETNGAVRFIPWSLDTKLSGASPRPAIGRQNSRLATWLELDALSIPVGNASNANLATNNIVKRE